MFSDKFMKFIEMWQKEYAIERSIDEKVCADKDGNPIENLEDYAVMDGKKELKAWAAIAEYMQSFEDTDKDGIANVPEYYDTTHERKVADNSKNIINLVKHPNKFAVAIVGICIVAVGVILLLIFGIVKIIRRRR